MWLMSEYEDKNMYVHNGAFVGSIGYVYDKEGSVWYQGIVQEIVREGDPLTLKSSQTGEFVVNGVRYAIGIEVKQECSRPDDIADNIEIYC